MYRHFCAKNTFFQSKSRLEKCGKVYKSRLKKCVEARKSGLEKCSKTMNLHHFGADLAKFCIILVQIL